MYTYILYTYIHTHVGNMKCGMPQIVLSGHAKMCGPPQFHPNIRNARL